VHRAQEEDLALPGQPGQVRAPVQIDAKLLLLLDRDSLGGAVLRAPTVGASRKFGDRRAVDPGPVEEREQRLAIGADSPTRTDRTKRTGRQ
jgi:hypothetical protein